MDSKKRTPILIIVIVLSVACLLLVCLAGLAFLFVGASEPFPVEEPTVTNTLNENQLEQCRLSLGINETIEIEGEYYSYTPGFLDDSLECHLRVQADSVEDIFDLTIVDPTRTDNQEISPGRYLNLTIDNPEPGLFIIEGFWFET